MSSDLGSPYLLFSHPNLASFPLLQFQLLAFSLLLLIIFAFCLSPGGLAWAVAAKRHSQTAIPGPTGLPLIGLLVPFSGPTAHRALARIAQTFRALPLMAFSIGLSRFVISSHPETAREILNSSAFADRPVKESAYELLFHRAMGFAPFGDYWRNLRRISATHLFSPKRITAFGGFRREIGEKMVEEIEAKVGGRREVEVRRVLHFGSLNNVMMTVFGRRFEFGREKDGFELEELVREGYELLGKFNWSDHFPLVGRLDLQGVRRRCRCLVRKVNGFVGRMVEEHRKKRKGGRIDANREGTDFVDVLLDLEDEDRLSDSDMIAVLWVSTLLSGFIPWVFGYCMIFYEMGLHSLVFDNFIHCLSFALFFY